MPRTITQKDAFRFFAPLVFMTELNMISKSVIHAFLARLAAPKLVLAAFSISFTFYYTFTSATEVSSLLALSFLRERRSLRRLLGFFCLLLALPMAVVQVVAWTPLGAAFYGGLFGAGPEVVAQAQWATFLFSLSAPILMLRALAFALIMLNRHNVLITLSTLLRLFSLGISLLVYPLWLSGAAVGAAALVTCMAVETAFAWSVAWRYYLALPESGAPLPSYGALWGFSWPLALNQATEIGIAFGINIFLGRLTRPELALAAFGVVHGLTGVMFSPMRNLVHTAQTLVRTRRDAREMARFTGWLVAGFSALVAAVVFSPLRVWVLEGVMGLTPELTAYSEPAIMLTLLIAAFWGYSALFRGLLAAARRTRVAALSGLARIAMVVLAGTVTLFHPGLNGAVFGIAVWALSLGVEAVILGWRVRAGRPGDSLFPDEPETKQP